MSAHPSVPRPWTLVRERSVRDFRVFRARTIDVADPRDGAEYVRTVLEAPDWVNVVALTSHDELVLVRQFRFGVWASTLEIPGGMIDAGEAPEVAAARELEEETGFRPAALQLLGQSRPNPAIQTNWLYTFRATGCVRVHEGSPEASEDIGVELVPRAEVSALVRTGAVDHALVLAALLLEQLASP